jgi:DNA polymerase-3 subunit epsilon
MEKDTMFNKNIYVIDLETTGTLERTQPTRITEIGVARIDINRMVVSGGYHTLVNPEEPLTDFIVSYTGLTNEKLKDAPKFKDIASSLVEFIGGKNNVIAAWPMSFEQPILQWEFANAGIPYPLDRRGIDIGTIAAYYMKINGIDLKQNPESKDKSWIIDNV